jgi:hypothetical protein
LHRPAVLAAVKCLKACGVGAIIIKAALKIKVRSSSAQVLSEIASQAYGSSHPRGDTAVMVHNHLLPSATALMDHLLHIVESPVCTENSILIDYVTESPNFNGDDRCNTIS